MTSSITTLADTCPLLISLGASQEAVGGQQELVLKTTEHLPLAYKRTDRPGEAGPLGDTSAKYRPVVRLVQERKVLRSDVHRRGLGSSFNLLRKPSRSRQPVSVDD